MNKFNSNNVTTLAKNKRNTALKRYLTVAITCAIVGVAMLPVMADSDAETAINNMSDIVSRAMTLPRDHRASFALQVDSLSSSQSLS